MFLAISVDDLEMSCTKDGCLSMSYLGSTILTRRCCMLLFGSGLCRSSWPLVWQIVAVDDQLTSEKFKSFRLAVSALLITPNPIPAHRQ